MFSGYENGRAEGSSDRGINIRIGIDCPGSTFLCSRTIEVGGVERREMG